MADDDIFAQLGDGPGEAPHAAGDDAGAAASESDWLPELPAPEPLLEAPRHPKYGAPAAMWIYRDAEGRLLFAVCRFNVANGKRNKKYAPLTFGTLKDKHGCRRGWHWRKPPDPQPLYGLPDLAARPDAPVLVLAEGEKPADAAAELFPDHVCVTWPGGSNAVDDTDWTPSTGRVVRIWPDNDAAGLKAAADVARVTAAAGAASVAVVDVPSEWRKPSGEEGWDVADPLPDGVTADTLRAMLAAARPVGADAAESAAAEPSCDADCATADESGPAMPPGFYMRPKVGVFRRSDDSDKRPDTHVCGPLRVVAATHDGAGRSWGVLLIWSDKDGREHDWAMPLEMLAGDSTEVRARLLEGGLFVGPSRAAREALAIYLGLAEPTARVRVVARLGWHKTSTGRVFVLPDRTLGAAGSEAVRLQTERPDALPPLRTAGELEDWQREVAARCRGNSRLTFAVSSSFTSPLLEPLEAEGGGINFKGRSSQGKSAALMAAGSVWGGGDEHGWLRSWRATDNALEATAAAHSDLLLCLDEMGEVEPEVVSRCAYMLANGKGKDRAARGGGSRPVAQWRVLFLSSGEVGLAERLAESRGGPRRARAGQEVRLVDIPADAGAGLGLFEDLHGAKSGEVFADTLKAMARAYYGTAGRAFLERLTAEPGALTAAAKEAIRTFKEDHAPEGASEQVRRVVHRFAVVAAAGEMARALGVVPWAVGEAKAEAARCLADWLGAREGGGGSAEDAAAIAAVRRFLELHGESRFAPLLPDASGNDVEPERATIQRSGVRRREKDGTWTYWIFAEAWRTEVCAGLHPTEAARALWRAGHLERGDEDSFPASKRVPGLGKTVRVYVVRGSIFCV